MKEPDFSNIEVEDYVDKYSEEGLWSKIRNNVTAIGIGLIYKIIIDLKAQNKEEDEDELGASDPLIKYRSTLEKLLKDFENSKPVGESENIIRMELTDGTTRTAIKPS